MATPSAPALAPEALSLVLAMRRLWSDHVIWTRDYIMAALAESPEAESAANRLLKNQEDIGNAVVPLYGEGAAKALTDLLKQHILIAVDLVDAAKSGDDARFQENDRKWTENAEQIAALLSSANPENWPQDAVMDLLMQHLNLTKNEVVARLQGNWDADIAAFDDIYTEILTVSDVLSDGLVKQFPDKFGAAATAPAAPAATLGEDHIVPEAAMPTNPEAEKSIVFESHQVGFNIEGKPGS
jgi:hypothetical protein